jgi:hypothetical protein
MNYKKLEEPKELERAKELNLEPEPEKYVLYCPIHGNECKELPFKTEYELTLHLNIYLDNEEANNK